VFLPRTAFVLFLVSDQIASIWDIRSAAGSLGAAIAAAVTIWVAQRDNRRRATFEQLREINTRLQALGGHDITDVQRELLRYYGHHRDDLPPEGRLYMDLLDSLELLAFSVEEGAAGKRIAIKYVSTILLSPITPLPFSRTFSGVAGTRTCTNTSPVLSSHDDVKQQRLTTSQPARA